MKTRYLALLFLTAFGNAWSTPIQWPVADGGNDHYYEYVSTAVSWDDARSIALAQSHLDLTGYLATITSQGEQDLLYLNFPEMSWIGGSDSEEEGVWKWMDGPDAGMVFWNHGPTDAFSFWHEATYEPNDEAEGEDYLQFAFAQAPYLPNGAWNDDGGPGHYLLQQGFIVEYGTTSAVPLPGSIWLFVTAAAGVARWSRRTDPSRLPPARNLRGTRTCCKPAEPNRHRPGRRHATSRDHLPGPLSRIFFAKARSFRTSLASAAKRSSVMPG